jgi:AcrR family transcriptional regulator
MASAAPAPLKSAPLQPQDWVRAAASRLAQEGIDAVRVEVLARELGVSKGSFYWHFRDREELLNALLADWESSEAAWLDDGQRVSRSAAARWALFVEHSTAVDRRRFEAAVRGWARQDDRVAVRVTAIEKRRQAFIADVLENVGFSPEAAGAWGEIALLVYLGWVDRSTRDAEFDVAGHGLGEFLSELVLAASARLPGANR